MKCPFCSELISERDFKLQIEISSNFGEVEFTCSLCGYDHIIDFYEEDLDHTFNISGLPEEYIPEYYL